jgi:hypothetical protein
MTTPPVNPYAPADVPAAGTNSLARASFIIAIVLAILAIVLQFVSRFAPILAYDLQMSASGIGVIFAVFAFVDLVLGVFGFVTGLLGARRGGPQLQAGIGMGVGGFVAITSLVSLVSTPLTALLY